MSSLATLLVFNVLFANQQTEQYDVAYQKAQENNQPLIVLVGAEWCPGCVKMKNQVIPEMKQKGSLSNIQFSQVNTDEEAELAEKLMSGRSIPQLIMYTKTDSGWRRHQLTGPKSASEVESFIQEHLPPKSIASVTTTTK